MGDLGCYKKLKNGMEIHLKVAPNVSKKEK